MKKLPEVIYIRSHAVSVKQALLMLAAFLGGLVLGMLISPKKGKKEERTFFGALPCLLLRTNTGLVTCFLRCP